MFRLLVLIFLTAACIDRLNASDDVRSLSDDRIVGGVDTNIIYHPHHLALEYRGNFYCGASIISPYWAVTAAHCCGPAIDDFVLRAGTSFMKSGGRLHRLSQKITHPFYNAARRDYDYDICLLKVTLPFVFGTGVSAIQLRNQGDTPAPGTLCTITGWGTTSEGGSTARVLQMTQVPTTSQSACQTAYAPYGITVNDRMICAGYQQGGRDTCQGDSGGPMVCQGKLTGVTSFGIGCARRGIPGVYAKISGLRSWIRATSGV